MARNLAAIDSAIVGEPVLRRVMQSLIFFGDTVAVRATYALPYGLSSNTANDIEYKVSELQEAGLVRLWAHEYELDRRGRARNPSDPAGHGRHADLIVDRTEFGTRMASLDEQLREDRELAYQQGDNEDRPRQGTAEIVALRSLTSTMLLASELNQDGIVANPGVRHDLRTAFRVDGTFNRAVVSSVQDLLNLPVPLHLSVDEILRCREMVDGFRALVDSSLAAAARGGQFRTITADAVATEVVDSYREALASAARGRFGVAGIGSEAFWDVVGNALPPSLILKYGLRVFRWRREAKDLSPFLLLMYLDSARTRRGS
jgi:hypothetical protein